MDNLSAATGFLPEDPSSRQDVVVTQVVTRAANDTLRSSSFTIRELILVEGNYSCILPFKNLYETHSDLIQ